MFRRTATFKIGPRKPDTIFVEGNGFPTPKLGMDMTFVAVQEIVLVTELPKVKDAVTTPRLTAPSCNMSEAVNVPPQVPMGTNVNGRATDAPFVISTP